MSVQIEMPQLSSDGESATLASWLVAVGDEVTKGEVIAELETDKSTVELEAPASGTIGELAVAEGSEGVAPGTLLGRIEHAEGAEEAFGVAGGGASSVEPSAPSTDPKTPTPPTPPTPPTSPMPPGPPRERASAGTDVAASDSSPPAHSGAASASATAEIVKSTPLARRAALATEVDVNSLVGTGPGGRVTQADVLRLPRDEGKERAQAPGSPSLSVAALPIVESLEPVQSELAEGVESVRLSAMRKTIARRMTESKQQVPHFYLAMKVSMDEVMSVRAQLNSALAEEGRDLKISVNDFILRAVAIALRDVPAANVQFAGDVMHVFGRVDVSVAVATEGGLVTPVIRDADRKGLTKLAEEVKALAVQAREGSLRPEQYQGGTFTISNLGMYGIDTVYPILNPPQACILGVGAAEEQPVVREGEIGIGRVATMTLAADHRAVDGAVGAELLAAIRSRLEDPMGMML
jgi:pyruvate dehydrogenase E2 component (dihydrolipoamide acetyltransferase)